MPFFFFYNSLQFFVAEQNPVWNNRAVPYLEKKKNNSAEKEGVLSLFSFPLARNKENGNIESTILIGFGQFDMIPVYALLTARKKMLLSRPYSEALCPRWTYKNQEFFCQKISSPSLTFIIPFLIIKAEFWQWYP